MGAPLYIPKNLGEERNKPMDMGIMRLSAELEKRLFDGEDTATTMERLPFFNFPAGFEIKPLFPATGAAVRFRVRKQGSDRDVSVYLDTQNVLGYMSGPYWEAYSINGDAQRYDFDEHQSMIDDIVAELSLNDVPA